MARTHPDRGDVRILLGGGIGSGKTIAGKRFAELGATVIEADRVGHDVIEPGGEAFTGVAERWPDVVDGGRIDRQSLARIVFADPDALAELEAVTHPAIAGRIETIAATAGTVVVEVPLMLDLAGAWTRVFVDAPEAVRIRRAVARGGDEADVRRRIANQADRDAWTAWADRIIDNGADLDHLYRQVDALWRTLTGPDERPNR